MTTLLHDADDHRGSSEEGTTPVPLREVVSTGHRIALDVSVGKVYRSNPHYDLPPSYTATNQAPTLSSTNAQLAAVADTMHQWVAMTSSGAIKQPQRHAGSDAPLPWVEAGAGYGNAPTAGVKRPFLGNPIAPSRSWGEKISYPPKPSSLSHEHHNDPPPPRKLQTHSDPTHATPMSVPAMPTPAESSVVGTPTHTSHRVEPADTVLPQESFHSHDVTAPSSVCHEAVRVQQYLRSGNSVFDRLVSTQHFTGVHKKRYDKGGHGLRREELRIAKEQQKKVFGPSPYSGRGTVLETTGKKLDFTATLRTPPRNEQERSRESGWT
jgi:hypothetical protein